MLSSTLYHADALMKYIYIWYISVLSKRRVHKLTSYVRTNQYGHKSMGLLFRTAEQHESPGWELPHWFLPFVPFLHFFITIEAPFTFWLHITFILCRHSSVSALQWRHNGRNVVSNHRRSIVCSAVCSGADRRKHQRSASLAFVRGIHRWPVNSPHKGPVTRKMFPFDDVIMFWLLITLILEMCRHSSVSIISIIPFTDLEDCHDVNFAEIVLVTTSDAAEVGIIQC